MLTPLRGVAAGLLAVLGLAIAFLLPPPGSGASPRGIALATVVLAILGFAAGRRASPRPGGLGRLPAAFAFVLGGLSLASGRDLWLELLPAFVWGCVAFAFARSLAEPASAFERLAHLVDARAPDFIAPYCRVVTALYAVLFAAVAGAIAWLALAGAHEAWRWLSGVGSWLVVAAFQAVEIVARKIHFRHYGRGPLDRVLGRLFPSENTARGRRSVAYLQGLAEHDTGAAGR